jgi:hypothetical protein
MLKQYMNVMIFKAFICFWFIFSNAHSIAAEHRIKNLSSYEEAYNIAYDLIMTDSDLALNVIKQIYNKNLPVSKQDIFYVNSIAALALRPIFRETTIGKKLLEKVVAADKSDFNSNSMLLSLSASENNISETRKYALNLLNANYIEYINRMKSASASESSLPEIRNYMDGIISIYQSIAVFFLQIDDKESEKKALYIVENIKNMEIRD